MKLHCARWEVAWRRSRRSRSLRLRHDVSQGFVLTTPPHVSRREAEKFIASCENWLARHDTEKEPIRYQTQILFDGKLYFLERVDKASMDKTPMDKTLMDKTLMDKTPMDKNNEQVVIDAHAAKLQLDCSEALLENNLVLWMRYRARLELPSCVDFYAKQLGEPTPRVKIGDQKSRWGSCSSARHRGSCVVSLNWRLIMMPRPVRAHICAHEVAHLRQRNHSARFYAVLDSLDENRAAADAWLAVHGKTLMHFGRFRAHDDNRAGG